MRISRSLLPLLAILLAMTVMVAVWPAKAEPEATASGWINEYPIPTSINSQPRSIVVESPGRVWFTMPMSNAIGSLTVTSTVDYEFSFYMLPAANSEPYDLALDENNGLIWFTERAGNRIGRLEMDSGVITDYSITTTQQVTPTGIAVAPNGQVWFTEYGNNRLGRFDPASEQFAGFPYPAPGGELEDLAVANDNLIWLTAPGLDEVALFTPSTGKYKRISVNSVTIGVFPPGDITVDRRNLPWVTAPSQDRLGPFLEGTLATWRWAVMPTAGGRPTGIALSLDAYFERAWYVQTDSGRVGQFLYSANDNRLRFAWDTPLPTANSQPRGIAVDDDGHAWITEMGANTIAEWRPPYFYFFYMPMALR